MKKGRSIKERICAVILAVLMPLTSVLPGMSLTVQAADTGVTEVYLYVYEEYTDGNGQSQKLPLAGATVTAKGTDSESGSLSAQAETDKNGKATLTFQEEVTGVTYSVTKKGFADVTDAGVSADKGTADSPQEQKMTMAKIALSAYSADLVLGSEHSIAITNKITNSADGEWGYTWKSSDEAVATVSNGEITAVGKGTATVSVSRNSSGAEDSNTANVAVTVWKDLSGAMQLTVTPAGKEELGASTEVTFRLTGLPEDTSQDVKVYMSGRTDSVATLKKSEKWEATATIDDLKGKIVFTAKYPKDSTGYYSESSTSTGEMSYKQKADMILEEGSETITYGGAASAIKIKDNSDKGRTVKYALDSSSAQDVATVDASGNITVLKPGTAVIKVTAAANDEYTQSEATYTLTVNKKDITIVASDITWDAAQKVYDGTATISLIGRVKKDGNTDVVDNDELVIEAEAVLSAADKGNYTGATITSVAPSSEADNANAKYNITLDENTLVADKTLTGLDVTVNPREVYLKAEGTGTAAQIEYGSTTADAVNSTSAAAYKVALAGTNGKLDSDNNNQGVLDSDITELQGILGNTAYAEITAGVSEEQQYVGSYPVVKVDIKTKDYGNYTLCFRDEVAYCGELEVIQEKMTDEEIWSMISVTKEDGTALAGSDGTLWVKEGDTLSFQVNAEGTAKGYTTVNVKQEDDSYSDSLVVKTDAEGIADITNSIYLSVKGHEATRTTAEGSDQDTDNAIPVGKLKIDTVLPVATFVSDGQNGGLANALEFINFITFANRDHTETVQVSDEGSGLQTVQYSLLKVEKGSLATVAAQVKTAAGAQETDWTDVTSSGDRFSINISKDDQAFYVMLVKVSDKVGNEAVYSSNGLVIELNKPEIELDVTSESINGAYPGDVSYSIKVTDSNAEEYSGIEKIVVKVTDGATETDEGKTVVGDGVVSAGSTDVNTNTEYENSYTLENDVLNEIKNISAESGYSPDALGTKSEYEIPGRILSDSCKTNSVRIEVQAFDQAGNEADRYTQTFNIDMEPKINSVTYDVTEEDGCYQSRTMRVQYQYHNFSEELAEFKITENGGTAATVTLKDIIDGNAEGITANCITASCITDTESASAEPSWEIGYHTRDRLITYDITFEPKTEESRDITYAVTPSIKNVAGTSTDTYEEQTFIIDTLDPVIDVSYDENKVKNGTYFNDTREMTITYTERNFDETLLTFDVSVNGGETVNKSLDELGDTDNAIIVGEMVSEANGNQYTLTITFGGEGKDIDYSILPHITDKAGNINDGVAYAEGTEAEKEFTIDMIAPVLTVAYTTGDFDNNNSGDVLVEDITSDIGMKPQDGMYKNMDIKATVTVTERNFAPENKAIDAVDAAVDETATDVNGAKITATSIQEHTKDAKALEKWSEGEASSWTQDFIFTEDANYTFNLTYTDMAGNTVQLVGENKDDCHYFTTDEGAPTGEVEIEETTFDKLLDMISFKFFSNNREKKEKVAISSADQISPVKTSYYNDPQGEDVRGEFAAKTPEELKAMDESLWEILHQESSAEDGYYKNKEAYTYSYDVENGSQIVPYTRIEDKAGNVIYLNSDGVICEDQKAAVSIEIKTPAPDTKAFEVSPEGVVYDSDVDFEIIVDEGADNAQVYSGIKEVSYEVRKEGAKTQSGKYEFTDGTARKEVFTSDETVVAEKNNSNNVQIYVKAVDWAGNVTECMRDIMIDITDPQISVSYDNNDSTNEKYFDADRTMTIVYTERNINREGLTFDFSAGGGETEVLTLDQLKKRAAKAGIEIFEKDSATDGTASDETEDVKFIPSAEWTDERTLTCTIHFYAGSDTGDMDYTIVPHIEDQAGRTAKAEYAEDTVAAEKFTVDKLLPEMIVDYYALTGGNPVKINVDTDEIGRLYENQTVRAVVKITERNFSTDEVKFSGEYAQVIPHFTWKEYDGTQGSVSEFEKAAVSRESWEIETLGSNVWVQSFDFVADGDYSFSLEYTDLAGNGLKTPYDTHYFTVDKTAPQISVVYMADGKVVTPGEREEDRLFMNKTITAAVTITERNFYREDDEVSFEDGQMNLTYTAVDAFGKTVGTSDKEDEENPIDNYTQLADTRKKWTAENGEVQYVRTQTFTFTKDANYTLAIQYKDLAGNVAVEAGDEEVTGHPMRYFTVDKTAPTGSIQIRDSIWKNLLETVTFGFFTNSSEKVTFTSDDKTAGVALTQYYKYVPGIESRGGFKALTAEQLDAVTEWKTAVPLILNTEQQAVIYEKIVDRAGNVTYINSQEGVVVDKTDAAPQITITMADPAHGIYNSNVPFRISVTDPVSGGTYAGLKEVHYEVRKDGAVTQSGNYDSEFTDKTQRKQSITRNEVVNAQLNNSNNVQIWVRAVDWAGNDSEITKDIKIDITDPTISVTYDLNSPLNDRYYNATRTATVVVTERNFDELAVRFTITNTDGTQPSISGWSHSAGSGVSDSATHTCHVTFSADGDYTFTLNTTDLAGNESSYTQVDDFTIDQTDPVIQVSYDNNNDAVSGYYNESRTATITVTEHNFNASEVNAAITASLQGSGVSAPGVGGWSTRGDVHTASVTFSEDADYTFDVDYTDLAGNAAADYTKDSFTVDKTAPEIEFFDIEDKSANNGTVAPGVSYSDVNYMESGVDITITGAKHPTTALDGDRSAIPNGESIKMADFAHTEENDDLYTLTAVIEDKAGNQTEESIMFSVNRFGSVYIFSDETQELLDKFYSNEEQELVVTEINVDTLVFNGISYGRDGELVNLEEGTDYTVKESGSDVSWKQYQYTVNKENFAEEGHYTVTIDSEDRAENVMNNKVKESDIAFVIDKTAPTVVITGIEDQEQYRADSKDMTVNVADNVAMDVVDVYVDDAQIPTKSYDEGTIREAGGELIYTIGNASGFQSIKAVARDAAGNEAETESFRVLVTSNLLIQYINNTPLLVGSIAAVLLIAGGVIYFVIIKRKKDKQENA